MSDVTRLQAVLRAHLGQLALSVELSIGAETLVLVGPNGAGKSSALLLLLGVHPLLQGHVRLDDTVLSDKGRGIELPVAERKLGYLPQNYGLFPHLSVEQNIEFAVRSACSAQAARDAAVITAQVSEALHALELNDLKHRYPIHLSGGEQQRVALARALSIKPRALLLDEPLAALDVHARRRTRSFLAEYLQKLALPTVIVTHDPADARTLGQKIAVMEAGRITQMGSWQDLETAPATQFIAEFVSA